jgi:hypothetical protein
MAVVICPGQEIGGIGAICRILSKAGLLLITRWLSKSIKTQTNTTKSKIVKIIKMIAVTLALGIFFGLNINAQTGFLLCKMALVF